MKIFNHFHDLSETNVKIKYNRILFFMRCKKLQRFAFYSINPDDLKN